MGIYRPKLKACAPAFFFTGVVWTVYITARVQPVANALCVYTESRSYQLETGTLPQKTCLT